MPIAAIILSLIQAGGAIARGYVESKKTQGWIDLGVKAAGDVSSAIELQAEVEHWVATNHTPSSQEIDDLFARATALHSRIQNAGKDAKNP